MAVAIDKPWQHRLPLGIKLIVKLSRAFVFRTQHPSHLALGRDQQAGKALNLALC